MLKKVMRKIRAVVTGRLQLLPYEHLRLKRRYAASTVRLRGNKFTVADGLSFYYSYKEIFVKEIYRFRAKSESPVIVDCGSNYGASIVYFKTLYPNAKITGVEADPFIYEILERNMAEQGFKELTLLNKALSASLEPVDFWSEGADGGRIVRGDDGKKSVKVNTMQLDALLSGPVDFLKIDIEGAETEVVISAQNLANVSNLFIEYHSFVNAPQTLDQLLAKLSSENFRYYIHTQFCSPRPLTEEKLQLGMDLQLNIFARRGA